MLEIFLIALLAILVGTNDAANVFGSAVGSKMLKFKFAIIFFFVFIIFGAVINAKYPSGIYQNLLVNYPVFDQIYLVLVPVILITLISLKLKIPSSISQSIIFSLFGFALAKSFNFDHNLFLKLIYFWIVTPLIAFILSIFFCYLIQFVIRIFKLNIFQIDYQIRLCLIFFGCLAAFALGSNLTASIVGIYSPFLNLDFNFFNSKILVSETKLYFFGSFLIGLGALLFSQRIIQSVGSQISTIKPISALAILLTQIIILLSFSSDILIQKINTISPFDFFAIPLSASHITFAGIIGVASFNKFREVQPSHSMKIIISWFLIPCSVFILSYFISLVF